MSADLTAAELDALFDRATHSIFRLETLPAYSVDSETDRIDAWRAGRPRPERSVRTDGFLAEVAAGTLAGVRWQRVRVLDEPVTEYQRYQMQGYVETQAAGCSVGVVGRDRADDHGTADFWLFDAGTGHSAAVLLDYSADGRPRGARPGPVDTLEERRRILLGMSTPLNEYLASVARGR